MLDDDEPDETDDLFWQSQLGRSLGSLLLEFLAVCGVLYHIVAAFKNWN